MTEAAQTAPTLRPLTVADLVDEIFRLYRANAALFFGVAAVVWLPAGVIYILAQVVFVGNTLQNLDLSRASSQQIASTLFVALGALSVALVVGAIAFPLLFGAITAAVSARYLGRPITIDVALRRAFACYWRVVASYTLLVLALVGAAFGTLLFGGLLAAVIGGATGVLIALLTGILTIAAFIWLGATWALVGQAIVIEDAGVLRSFGRSRGLVSGSRWRVVGITLLLTLIESVLFTVPSTFVSVLTTPLPDPFGTALSELVSVLAQSAYFPVQFGTLTLLYYDLRVRREGFDLSLAAEQLAPA
jgi:hypothetical protein